VLGCWDIPRNAKQSNKIRVPVFAPPKRKHLGQVGPEETDAENWRTYTGKNENINQPHVYACKEKPE